MGNSQGKQCAAFGCNSRAYEFGNGQRENTNIKILRFPKIQWNEELGATT